MNMEQMRKSHIGGCDFVIIVCIIGLCPATLICMILGALLAVFMGQFGFVLGFIPDVLIVVAMIWNIKKRIAYMNMPLPHEYPNNTVETHCLRKLNTKRIGEMQKKFYALDLETTGLETRNSEIIQIALVEFTHEEVSRTFSTFVKPYFPIPESATQINHITNSMVEGAPDIVEALTQLRAFAPDAFDGTTPCVAHNAQFDISFLEEMFKYTDGSVKINYYDTLEQAKNYIEHSRNYKLQTLAEKLKINIGNAHRADSDAITCGQLFIKLFPYAQKAAEEEITAKAKKKLEEEEAAMVSAFLSLSDEEKKALLSKKQ